MILRKLGVIKLVGLFAMVSFVIACASKDIEINKEAGKFSVVAVSDPSFKPLKGEKIIWERDLFVQDTASDIKVPENEKHAIIQLISEEFEHNGFQMNANDLASDYHLSGLILLGEPDISQVIPDFSAYPQLAESIRQYKDGSLLLALTKKQGDAWKLMWEGAIQVYILGEDISDAERAVRIQGIVKRLIEEVPKVQ